MRKIGALAFVLSWAAVSPAQEPQKPGKEHQMLATREGTWNTTMKFGPMETKGVTTYKMQLGGMWLVGNLESELFGQKFFGKSLDSYDATKKKYVGIWCDSMSGTPLVMEGDYDSAKKTLTMVGEGPGMDGKMTKWKSVTEMPDEKTMNMSMYVGGEKDPMFTVTYKKK